MNNDLDFIRNIRPPAADPTTEVVQHEREHLMQFIQDNQTNRPRRRGAAIGIGVAVSVVALGGVAAAAGLIPDAVIDRFSALEQRDGAIQIDSENATMVASARSGTNCGSPTPRAEIANVNMCDRSGNPRAAPRSQRTVPSDAKTGFSPG